MKRKHSTIQFRLYLTSVAVLLAGLLCAAWVYLEATEEINSSNAVSYEVVAGHNYALTTDDSKRYQYDMERIGGKSVFVAEEISQWFASLWHGKRLSFTIALLSIVVSLACFLVAQHPDYKLEDSRNKEENG